MIKTKSTRFRLFKAYSTTMRILISFGWIYLLALFLGSTWRENNMKSGYVSNAKRLRNTILEIRGLFIKVGQLISIMSNFLPEEFRVELEGLQDKIPPRPVNEIYDRISIELDDTHKNLFKSFNETPIASASLAQVHEAYLHNGKHVAVKVQYVDIEKMAKKDLKTLGRILSFVGFIFRIKGIKASFKEIKEMILDELDFDKEAKHIESIAANFTNNPEIKFPEVIHSLSTHRVLTTGFIEGKKVSDLNYLKECKLDKKILAERIVEAYCQMIFVNGLYHADPHPGNIIIQQDGSIVFIDFGAVAKLSQSMKEGIPQFLEGVLKRNKTQIIDSLKLMGFITHGGNSYDVDTLIDYIYSSFLQELSLDTWSLKDISIDIESKMEIMGDIRKLNISIKDIMANVQIPKDWVLLERTVLLLMGLCTHLDKDMNPMKTIKPYLETVVFGEDRDWKKFVSSIAKDIAMSVVKIPQEMNKILLKTNKGELAFNVKDVTSSINMLYALGHQIIYGLFSMLTGTLAYISYINNETTLIDWLIGTSAFFGFCLIISMWKIRKKRKKNK